MMSSSSKRKSNLETASGEVIYPWGTAEVVRLGLYADFTEGCGRVIGVDTDRIGGVSLPPVRYEDVAPTGQAL